MKALVLLALIAIPWDVSIKQFGISLKPAHAFFALFILAGVLGSCNSVSSTLRPVLRGIIFFTALFFLNVLIVKNGMEEMLPSFIYLGNFLIFVLGAFFLVSRLLAYGDVVASKIVIWVLGVYAVLGFSELALYVASGSFIFSSLAPVENGSYLLGQFLADEPNWISTYLVLLGFYPLFVKFKEKNIRSASVVLLLMTFLTLLSGSRTGTLIAFVFFLAFYGSNKKYKFVLFFTLAVVAAVAVISDIGLDVLPESYTYDILDSDRNPRLFDSEFVLERLEGAGSYWFGDGFGPITKFTDEMTWRETYPVSNQLWLHFFVNFGFFGLVALVFALIYWMAKIRRFFCSYYFFAFVLVLQLHNFFFKPMFGVLFMVGVIVYYAEKSNSSRVRLVERL